MTFKFIAGICIVLAGFGLGCYHSERLKSYLEICSQTAELFRSSSIMIRYRGLDVYEMANDMKKSGKYPSLTFLHNIPESYIPGDDFHEIWRSSVMREKIIPSEEQKLLCGFGDIIGSSDTEGQIKSITAFEKEAELLTDQRKEIYIKKGKLYRSIGLLFGLMGAILVM